MRKTCVHHSYWTIAARQRRFQCTLLWFIETTGKILQNLRIPCLFPCRSNVSLICLILLLSFIISSTLSFISDWFHLLIFMQICFLKWTYRRSKLFISVWLFIRSSFDVTMINARACLWFKRRIIINIKVRLCL